MTNRSNIKWQPFESVISTQSMLNNVLKEKNKIAMPILSEDQYNNLQNKIFTSYHNKDVVTIKYYKAGRLYKIKGSVTNIDQNNQKIIINNHFSLFFSQIIDFL